MRNSINILRGRPWLLLAALFAWLHPQTAAAKAYLEDPDHYSVSLGGTNIVYFEAPVYDCNGGDQWITDGNLKVSVDGGTAYTVFSWKSSETDINNSNTTLSCNFSTSTDGFFDITLGNTRNTSRLTKDNGGDRTLQRNSDGLRFTFSAEWAVPYNLLGKQLEFSWEVKRDGNGYSNTTVSGLKNATIKMPAASAKLTPFISTAMMDPNSPGKLQLPWFLASQDITKAYYEYRDADDKYHKENVNNVTSGIIMLDANVPHKSLRVVCGYMEKGDKGEYEIEVGSSAQNVPLIHGLVGLTARPLSGRNPKVELSWGVPYPDDEDLTPTDFFEIQRSLTGKEEDFKTISSSVFYASIDKKTQYTYVDSTLLEAIQTSMLVNGGTLDHLTYRVRRAITKDWGWGANNNCAATASCVMENLHLLRIADYSARWEDEQAYSVRVSWNYEDERGAVWDERAKMMLRVVSRNREGATVDSLTFALDDNERAQRYKIVNLTRSCVYYNIDMYVERNESPINFLDQTEEYFFPIHNVNDWTTFRDKVKNANGQYVNARLYADISLNSKDYIVGYSGNYPYRGIFDGNGHTITLNISDDAPRTALFSHVGNATFRNLHTAGTVTSSQKMIGGLIGSIDANSNVTIENCRSSVTISSSVNGDGTNGGFVGTVEATTSSVTFRNCKFDGSIEGANCSHNGGYVGYANGAVIVDNCLFAPERISTKSDGCQTWARVDKGSLNIINSYATREYKAYIAIRNANDWKTFQTMVENAKNQYDVDAVLQADITTSEYVGGGEAATFRGTFDGNGHTLTFNKNWTSNERYIAPFRYVGDATIKNLHVAGTIESGQMYATGLVAQVLNGTATIENCQSSATLKGTMNGEGCLSGFVGRVTKSKVTIRNCKFDGSFEGNNCHGNSGFVSWVDEVSSATIENCLFMPDHIGTYTFNCNTWGRKDDRGSLTVTNSHYTRDYFVFPISNASDWEKFRDMVSASQCKYWVDAVLTADITTDLSIGWESGSAYHGTFDGNGHTITFNISDTGVGYLALFRHGNGYTIKNLHVKGKVSGSDHSAGLVGYSIGGNGYNKIQNCRVSASIECSNMYAGGFGGNTTAGGGADITNCLFDGSIWCQKAQVDGSQNRAAPFFGFSEPVNYDNEDYAIGMGQNYCLEKGTYYNIIHLAMNHKRWTHWGNWENTYCHDIWTYNGLDQGYSVGDRPVSEMVAALGDQWHEVGGLAVPKMTDSYSSNRWYTGAVTANEMVSALGGNGWEVVGGKAVPKMESATVDSKTSLDDLLAKLVSSWVKEGETINPKTTTIDDTQYTSGTFFIRSNDDWGKFSQMVEEAKGQRDVNAVLMTDINAGSVMIGQESNTAYRGTFDGNGHTVTFNMVSQSTEAIAPFHMVSNATIKNLHMVGSIESSKKFASGLIGQIVENATVDIENCHSSITIKSHVNGDATSGGFIGLSNGNATISNCLFDGSFEGADCYSNGGFVGWTYRIISIKNCLFAPGHISTKLDQCKTWGRTNAYSLYRINNCYATQTYSNDNDATLVGSMPASELAAKLGSENWQVADNKVIPVFESSIPNFYHKNSGTIDQTLLTTTRQSSVLLAWNTDGKPIDYFRVMRRVKGEGDDKWIEVATNLTDMSYEDTSVSPLAVYEYKVQAVNDCEGITITETNVKVGESKHTGRAEGYVRFNDGTGAPGIKVAVSYKKNEIATVETDESGYFEVEELSYQGGTDVTYSVGPAADSGVKIDPVAVTFDATSNNRVLREFTIENGRRFSGYVMYDGTSIPVKGVNFLVDGNRIHNAKGEFVETDYDGSFSFRVLDGQHTIQAVMDKHVFTNDGYYKNSGKQNLNADVAGIYFYDATKVTLTGRIVGGDDQGQKPLMNNLSMNNLGDSLTMVLTLEGDNTSWLVYDNLNPNKTKREEVVRHQRGGDKHYTAVTTERKRMTVWPDVTTGEYTLMLPPVRWKVQQVYCAGYPTLFQEGQVSEVIDLTDCLDSLTVLYDGTYYDADEVRVEKPTATYNAVYNRIYHNPVEVTYKQIGYDSFDYFGDKTYAATELSGAVTQVPLVYSVRKPNWPANRKDSLVAVYTLGHPVFSVERQYNIQLQVAERYLYNNDPLGRVDLVPLKGGTAYMQNGMRGLSIDDLTTIKEPQLLDSLGQCVFTLKADQTSNMSNCLRTVTFTVERDSTFIQAEPLQAYVLNMFPVGASQDIMTEKVPILYDILRDPPGAYSSNTLAKGATINYTYMMNASITAGAFLNIKYGEKLQSLSAAVQTLVSPGVAVGTAVGPINGSDNVESNIDMFMYNGNGSKAFSHTMVVGNNVSTSGDPSLVGADADLYIGSVQNVVVTPMSTIRAVTNDMLKGMIARLGKDNIVTLSGTKMDSEVGKNIDYGTVTVIASGLDAKGDTIHLIRDLALGYGPKIESNFIYSQKQLLTQIIPTKAKEIVDMMFLGTKEEAQTIADRTKKAVYLSLRQPTDSLFAVVNSKKPEGHAYNTKIEKAEKGINYLVVLPTDADESKYSDEVAEKYQVIKAWVDMIAQNEAEKLQVTDKLTNYDVAGAAGVNYSETFDASYSSSWSNFFPIATEVDYFNLGAGASNAFSALSIAGSLASAISFSLLEMKAWSAPKTGFTPNIEIGTKSEVSFFGKLIQWSLFPVASYTTVGADSEAKSYNRTESFTIACDPSSHLNVDVYRAWYDGSNKSKEVTEYNVFTNDNFNRFYDMVKGQVDKSLKSAKINGPRGFIFRTRGGATQNPWEDQRVTKVYSPGTQLDARTLKIVNPKIRLDKQSVSGVAIDEAAKFTVYVGNDSEKPEATEGLTVLQVFVPDQLNPQGCKFYINGQVLTTGGMTVTCVPGKETVLQMEVRAGEGFDFENLVIGVMSPTDPEHTWALATFDVHFLREAGGVNIAVPGDKWVLNTNAQKDGKRGWYIPVTINGFDRHQHNFDHIEFQYKESQRGDDAWTNLCSYYADEELMAKANGVRELMKPDANIVTEFYGEGWVMEREYDLRAVLFCRNGNDFLTTSSKVIHGIKDTRRPQLFGTPEPKSGLLTQSDDIVFNFSEDIEYNYLSAITNFEVKGEVNNNSVSENVSVQFTGKGSVETEAKRNFSGKDVTIDLMVKPEETGRDMPLFSHGTNGQKLQLWLTKDFKLRAVVNDQTFESDSTIAKNAFRQVAVSINQQDSTLTFFKGGLQIGRNKMTALYNGTGTLIFGRTNEQNRDESQYYEGRMMEARLWYSAMDGTLIGSTYGGKRLTGYEKDLVDYYPMNEGSRDYVTDRTQGANAKMIGTSWAVPRGWSLHLEKENKGVLLDKNALNRTSDHDYTLMFWFKTDAEGRGALLSNGRGLKEDNGAENLFHIGFEGDKLMYRSNGFSAEVPGNWGDGQWHNFAMTVNRARNVANIYMDKELRTTFEADSLGGISGGHPLIGATRYDVLKENGGVEVKDGDDAMKGNVDELLFFAQALPQRLIETYAAKSPNGDEAGLMTYLSFDRTERQKDNDLELVPYVYSKKLYLDDKGQPRYQLDPLTKEPTDTLVRDYFFVASPEEILPYFDQTQAAPVVPYEEVRNLKFGFIGRGNQLLVELDENAAKLNHRNIYVTVRDVEDKNGNTMASPQTACYYVVNSSLQWVMNRLDYTIKYGTGEDDDQEMSLPFYNSSATRHTYTIDNCPRWLKLSKYSDAITPQNMDYVDAKVSKDLNVGTYSEIIYLTDEDGISEPFYFNLTVEGEQPDWTKTVNRELLQNSMSISGQVYLFNELDTDSRDIVGAFDNDNVCHGFANISHDVQSGDNGLYLTVYDNQSTGRELSFRLWQYNTGRELVLTTKDSIKFEKDAMLGTDTLVRFNGGKSFMQYFDLKKGWNWVSFNVNSDKLNDVNKLLNSTSWSEGDILTELSGKVALTYKDKRWLRTGTNGAVAITPQKSYAIKVKEDCTFPIGGTVVKDAEARTVTVQQGWNGIGYTPVTNLTVETALSDYYDHAEQGDVIKSHTEFAYFTKSGNVGRWRGSLQYMKPGEGYMLLRKDTQEVKFTYPFYEIDSNIFSNTTSGAKGATAITGTSTSTGTLTGTVTGSMVMQSRSTMCASAAVTGISLEHGDRLTAYSGGELVGSEEFRIDNEDFTTADGKPLFFLTIGGESKASIWFAIERGGEIVASTGNEITFHADDVLGTPDEPYVINFDGSATGIRLTDGQYEEGKWYTVNGAQLSKRPKKSGVYIYNYRKVVIK